MNEKAHINEIHRPITDLQEICFDVLQEKYAKGKEKGLPGPELVQAIRQRVGKAIASEEQDPKKFENVFIAAMETGFIPGGRVNSVAGTGIRNATLINCFVQPVGDSVSGTVDGKPGIYPALCEAAETMRRGGGVGYDFSSIRPKGAPVKGTGSSASGPVSYLHVFDQSCSTVVSAGARRGAQMGVLRIDHPDIVEFIQAKQIRGHLNNFNLSVGVTDAFMRARDTGTPFELVHKAEPAEALIQDGAYQRDDGLWVYRRVDPIEIWSLIMRSTYNVSEPGVLFLDRINAENNLHYCEVIEACNPCGEQPLPDFGCCCLGSLNLTAYVIDPFTRRARFDFYRFAELIPVAVRMLDNVLDLSEWPLPQQRQEAMEKRRIGLGYTGLGDTLIELNLRYGSAEGREFAAKVTQVLRDTAYRASIELAKGKGAFPKFDAEPYLASGFARRLPEDIRSAIREYGIRNSHLLSIAPTGSISLAFADNASNGIEPAFSWRYYRAKWIADGTKRVYAVEDHAYRLWGALGNDRAKLPEAFVSAREISAKDQLLMQAAVQPFIDASISKTVNVSEAYPFDQFVDLYRDAWRAGLKGITIYRPNKILGHVLSLDEPNERSKDPDPSEPGSSDSGQ